MRAAKATTPARLAALGAVALAVLGLSAPARATDEIQVYNAEIAAIGQWTIEQHLNYTSVGRTQPDFPGGLVPNHSLNGTPELAYGITDWWELGFYAPFAVNSGGQFLSNAGKIRNLFVSPNAADRNFFYGLNFEWSYETPPFAQTQYALEIRPIIGVRNPDWEFIVNPIVDLGFGAFGEADFAPAVRLVRNLGHDVFVGAEYYGDYGKIGDFLPLNQQQQELFAVTDFKAGVLDIELGAGYGFTAGSDRFITKAIVGYAFPVPGKGDRGTDMPLKAPAAARSATLVPWQTPSGPDVFAASR